MGEWGVRWGVEGGLFPPSLAPMATPAALVWGRGCEYKWWLTLITFGIRETCVPASPPAPMGLGAELSRGVPGWGFGLGWGPQRAGRRQRKGPEWKPGFSTQPPATWSHHRSSLRLYFPLCTMQPSEGDTHPKGDAHLEGDAHLFSS